MEMRLNQSKSSLKTKIPDIKKTLEMVQLLHAKKVCPLNCSPKLLQKEGKDMDVHFELSDSVFASANVKPSTACLWLGVFGFVPHC